MENYGNIFSKMTLSYGVVGRSSFYFAAMGVQPAAQYIMTVGLRLP